MSPYNLKVRVFILLVQASSLINLASSNVLESDSLLIETTTRAARKHNGLQRQLSTPQPRKSTTTQLEPTRVEVPMLTTLKTEATTVAEDGETIDFIDDNATIAFNYTDVTGAQSVEFGNVAEVTEEGEKIGATEDFTKVKGAASRATRKSFSIGPKYILFGVVASVFTKLIRVL